MSSISADNANYRGDDLVSSPLLLAVVFAALLLSSGCGSRTLPHDGPEQLSTSDGLTLAGHRYVPAVPLPPGLVLVHRAGGNQGLWEAFAIHAQQSGYLVVTMDLRGHGESVDGSPGSKTHRQFSDDDWQNTVLDIDAALRRLLALGAAPNNLFLAGEGFGANLALKYTVDHQDVQGVVLLSPGTSYYGIESGPLMERLRTRPSLLVWSDRDEYAAATAATLQARAPGHVEMRVYAGRAHGADIFTSSPEAAGQIVVWLDQMREEPAAGRP